MELPGTEPVRDSNVRYWSIIGGEFVTKASEADEGARKRVNKKGVLVYEIPVKSITGIIKDIDVRTGEYGDELTIKVDVGVEVIYMIQIMIGDTNGAKTQKYFRSFVEKLYGIKPGEPVTIRPYNFEDEAQRKMVGVSLLQDAKKIGHQYLDVSLDKDGKKIYTYKGGCPPFPNDWDNLTPRDQQNYLYDLKEFYMDVLSSWRETYIVGNEPVQAAPVKQAAPEPADKGLKEVAGAGKQRKKRPEPAPAPVLAPPPMANPLDKEDPSDDLPF